MPPSLNPLPDNLTVGVAGCGAMGLPMARALAQAGMRVKGFDVRPLEEFSDFQSHMMTSPEAFAADIDVLISVVRDQPQTLDLYFDRQAVFKQSHYPKICLLASTVSPRFLHDVKARLPDDVLLIDTPMSGAPIAAIEARLSFMIGADEETASPVRPLLEAMGNDLHFLGGFAMGMAAKVLNNFVAASSVTAVRQVLAEARTFGLEPTQLLDVMKSSSGATWFGDRFEEISWSRELYDPANTIGIVEKDVNSLLDALSGEKTGEETLEYIKGIRDRLGRLPPPPKMD